MIGVFENRDYIERARIYLWGAILSGVYLLIGVYVFYFALPNWTKYNAPTDLGIAAILVYSGSVAIALYIMIVLMVDRGAPKERLLNDLLKASVYKHLLESTSDQTSELTIDSLPTISPDIDVRKIYLLYKSGLSSGIPFNLSNLTPALDNMVKDIKSKVADGSGEKKQDSDVDRGKPSDSDKDSAQAAPK